MKKFHIPIEGVPVHYNEEPLEIAYTIKPPQYLWRTKDTWVPRNQTDTKLHLRYAGLHNKRTSENPLSEVEQALRLVHDENVVDIALPLGGRTHGRFEWDGRIVLVTKGCKPTVPQQGDWSTLRTWLVSLFGEQVLERHMGWWMWGRKSVLGEKVLPGQVPIYIGPSGAGKSFLQKITTMLLGGRSANPFPYMAGKTNFNYDLFTADHLVIEDQFFDASGKVRREFGTKIKELAVNQVQWCQPKFGDALNLRPKWRISMSMNSEEENRQVLPPLDNSILEKLMLIKTGDPCFPVDLDTEEGWDEWDRIIEREVPFLAHDIDNFVIPEELRIPRYAIKPWHDPELLREDQEATPEAVFLSCLKYDLPAVLEPDEPFWEGKAIDLERLVLGQAMPSRDQFRKLLNWQHACGVYLGRIAKRHPDVITDRKRNGYTVWRIDVEALKSV